MKIVLFSLFILLSFAAKSQKSNDYLLQFTVKQDVGELYGYKYKNGKVAIKAQYNSVYTDTLYEMAIVLKNWKWVGVDRRGAIILVPFIYDNGPDYVQEGLFRFVEKEKMGFANLDGKKVIAAQFSFVTPFKNGIAEYYIGGERIYKNGKTRSQILKEIGPAGFADNHWSWGGKVRETGYVNKFNQKFKKVGEFKNGTREALTSGNNSVLLNKVGEIVKRF